jgi:hypothetical protein
MTLPRRSPREGQELLSAKSAARLIASVLSVPQPPADELHPPEHHARIVSGGTHRRNQREDHRPDRPILVRRRRRYDPQKCRTDFRRRWIPAHVEVLLVPGLPCSTAKPPAQDFRILAVRTSGSLRPWPEERADGLERGHRRTFRSGPASRGQGPGGWPGIGRG